MDKQRHTQSTNDPPTDKHSQWNQLLSYSIDTQRGKSANDSKSKCNETPACRRLREVTNQPFCACRMVKLCVIGTLMAVVVVTSVCLLATLCSCCCSLQLFFAPDCLCFSSGEQRGATFSCRVSWTAGRYEMSAACCMQCSFVCLFVCSFSSFKYF